MLLQYLGGTASALMLNYAIMDNVPKRTERLDMLLWYALMPVVITAVIVVIGRAFGQRGSIWLSLFAALLGMGLVVAVWALVNEWLYSSQMNDWRLVLGAVLPILVYQWSDWRSRTARGHQSAAGLDARIGVAAAQTLGGIIIGYGFVGVVFLLMRMVIERQDFPIETPIEYALPTLYALPIGIVGSVWGIGRLFRQRGSVVFTAIGWFAGMVAAFFIPRWILFSEPDTGDIVWIFATLIGAPLFAAVLYQLSAIGLIEVNYE